MSRHSVNSDDFRSAAELENIKNTEPMNDSPSCSCPRTSVKDFDDLRNQVQDLYDKVDSLEDSLDSLRTIEKENEAIRSRLDYRAPTSVSKPFPLEDDFRLNREGYEDWSHRKRPWLDAPLPSRPVWLPPSPEQTSTTLIQKRSARFGRDFSTTERSRTQYGRCPFPFSSTRTSRELLGIPAKVSVSLQPSRVPQPISRGRIAVPTSSRGLEGEVGDRTAWQQKDARDVAGTGGPCLRDRVVWER
ncbi:hypothetical protein BKA80DRAFT_272220 [Phyllosticta citrichinensis]